MSQITFAKKAKPEEAFEAPEDTLSDFAALIDQIGEMSAAAVAAKATVKAFADLTKELREKVTEFGTDLDDDAKFKQLGAHYTAQIGARGNTRAISDPDKVKAIMGADLFMKLATVNLKDIDDYLNPDQREEVLDEGRSDRSVKIVSNTKV